VPYTVGSNPAPAARTAIIDVGGQKVQLSQAAAPCRFNLNRTRDSLPAEGGDATVDVTTLSGCSWSAVSNAAWIAIVAGQNGSASGTVRMSVAANGGVARTGQVTIGDQAYIIDQAARVTTPAPSPTPPPTPAPTPAPAPTPTPTPAPGGESIDLEGRIVLLGGTCPAVAFWVDGRVVVTSQATDYKRGRCEDLSNGDSVTASGTVRPDRAVDATRIELKKR